MKYLLFITMLLGVGYSQCPDGTLPHCDGSGECIDGSLLSDGNCDESLECYQSDGGDCFYCEECDPNAGYDAGYEAGAESADPCYGVVCDDDPEMICICGECTYEDEQGDTGGAEDCSYGDECFEAGAESGDLNLDGVDNVQDVVILINNILAYE